MPVSLLAQFCNVYVYQQKGAMKLHKQQEVVGSLKGYTKGELMKLEEQMHKSYEEQLQRITEMV